MYLLNELYGRTQVGLAYSVLSLMVHIFILPPRARDVMGSSFSRLFLLIFVLCILYPHPSSGSETEDIFQEELTIFGQTDQLSLDGRNGMVNVVANLSAVTVAFIKIRPLSIATDKPRTPSFNSLF